MRQYIAHTAWYSVVRGENNTFEILARSKISGQCGNSPHHCCRRKHKAACKQQAEQHLRVDITTDGGSFWPIIPNQSSSSSVNQSRAESPASGHKTRIPPPNGTMNMDVKHTRLFPVKIQVWNWHVPIPEQNGIACCVWDHSTSCNHLPCCVLHWQIFANCCKTFCLKMASYICRLALQSNTLVTFAHEHTQTKYEGLNDMPGKAFSSQT